MVDARHMTCNSGHMTRTEIRSHGLAHRIVQARRAASPLLRDDKTKLFDIEAYAASQNVPVEDLLRREPAT